jgi:hypothetical protein
MAAPIVKASYFENVCREVFDTYLLNIGFSEITADKYGSVYYMDETFFLRIGYLAETFPDYSPELITGILTVPPNFEKPEIRESVGFWKIIPDTDEASNYSLWSFSNRKTLKSVLDRIKTTIIADYGTKIFSDRNILYALFRQK